MQRRNFFKLVGAASAVAMLPKLSYGAPATAKVVVVGGGLGGAAVAKYLRAWRGSDNIMVTLVTPAASYVSCIQSNLVVTGAIPASRITRDYGTLSSSRYNVTIQHGLVTSIDPALRRVYINDSSSYLDYDYLVLAPGVKFSPYDGDPYWPDSISGPNPPKLSYWQGDRASALETKLDAMVDREIFVMYIPSGPIKGGQAPYGRACAVADKLWSTSRRNCTVKVLDGHVPVAPATSPLPSQFVAAFASFDNIEYHHSVTLNPVNGVNLTAKLLNTSMGSIHFDVANVIPPQRANLDFAPALLAGHSFAPVNPQTFQSTVVGYDRVYIIGDAQGTPNLPKSGNIAADQAKICASAITRRIAGLTNHPLETSLAVSAVQFNAIRSTPGHLAAVYAHAGYQWNAAAHDATHPFNGWMPSSSYPDAGVSASGAVPASSKNYSQGLTWVQTLLDDCFI